MGVGGGGSDMQAPYIGAWLACSLKVKVALRLFVEADRNDNGQPADWRRESQIGGWWSQVYLCDDGN